MELQRTLDNLLKWMHRYVSPVFLALLVASFILWYIAKLSYTYTTEQVVRVSVDGEPFEVTCVVEGVGTNLFGYRVYMNKTLRIPLSELKYKRSREEGHEGKVVIDPPVVAKRHFGTLQRHQGGLHRGCSRTGLSRTETMMKIGITGGIGSGKSTVCRLFAQKGVAVYDSDAAAKRLMQQDDALRVRLTERFGAGTFRDGQLDRGYLAGVVFSDPQALADLNALVHPVVMADFDAWAARQEGPYVILESAILFEAGLETCVDKTVAVLAPCELRIERTCRRDDCGPDEVGRRIAAQLDDDTLSGRADYTIVNIFEEDLEPAVVKLDRIFSHEAARH